MNSMLTDEVEGADFGDKRLSHRLGKLITEMGEKPNMSIPSATRSRAELEAAYRFFSNEKVSPDKILQPHMEATHERIAQQDFVLLVQDTTEISLTRPSQQVAGAGPMDSEVRRGAFFHPLMAFTKDGLPLGTAWQKNWTRDKIETNLSKYEKGKRTVRTPIEQKESFRWIEGLRTAHTIAESCSQTEFVCVSDSESDIYDLFAEQVSSEVTNFDLIVRLCQNRSTMDGGKCRERAQEAPCVYKDTVNVSKRTAKIPTGSRKRQQSHDARMAEVEVRATQVKLRPSFRPAGRKLPEATINIVLIEETNPPKDSTPIQWMLATTMPIEDVDRVRRIVKCYCLRWQIEIYFRTLKSGCRVEERQFETLPRVMNCLAVYAIIAWRIMYLCRLGRDCPDLSCEVVLEPCEWKSVYTVAKGKELPSTPPSLNEMIRLIASLGGYVIRKKTEPGTQTLWLGMQRVHDLATGWLAFGPGASNA